MTAQQKDLQQQIDRLSASTADMVPMAEVRKLLDAVRSLLQGEFDDENLDHSSLLGELGEVARMISQAKRELRDFNPGVLQDEKLPEASDQLDAIVKTTEAATHKIMDNCERLTANLERARDRLLASPTAAQDPDLMVGMEDAISEAGVSITEIYEACNFQDLTGQRIQKIVRTMREVERQILRMVIVFSLQKADKAKLLDQEQRDKLMNDAELLNGPQLPGQSMAQEDIDDILDALL